MKEIDVRITVRYRDPVEDSTIEWAIEKLGEEFYNIGYDFEDLEVETRVVARRNMEEA